MDANVWTNPNEIPDNGLDDDHNGYVDDVNGWNFVENNNDVRTSVFDKTDDPEAVDHGTLVAGLIGAIGDNDRDGVGVNWQVQIMPLRAVDSNGSGSLLDVARAVDYAVDNGADVISMSFVGNDPEDVLKKSLKRAYNRGVVIVAAAGNNNAVSDGNLDVDPEYPVCFDSGDAENWILGVSSVGLNDQLSDFADYGGCVDIVAPGEGIMSTERYAPAYNYKEEFGGKWYGTSFAAPMVAGAAALLKSVRPDWGAKEIIADLLTSTDNIDASNPDFKGKIGSGRLNIGKAVAAAVADIKPHQFDNLYYYKGNQIFKYSFNSNSGTVFATTIGGQILNLSANDNMTLALVKQDKKYLVDVYSNSGFLRFELYLGEFDKTDIRKIQVVSLNKSDEILVEQLNKKTQNSTLLFFDENGQKTKELAIGKVSQWNASIDGVVAVQVAKNNAYLTYWDADGNKTYSQTMNKIASISDLRLLNDREAVLISAFGGKAEYDWVDMPSGANLRRVLPKSNINSWRLFVSSPLTPGKLILPFNLAGGIFYFSTARGSEAEIIKMPKIAGSVN